MESVKERSKTAWAFALPASVVAPHLTALAERGTIPRRQTAIINPYRVAAYVFEAVDELGLAEHLLHVKKLVDEALFQTSERCQVGRRQMTFYCGLTGEIEFAPVPVEDDKDEDDEDEEGDTFKGPLAERPQYMKVGQLLARMSRLCGGVKIILHEECRDVVVPPKPDKPGVIDIYPWSHPPGKSEGFHLKRAFGRLIDRNARGILTFKGIPGRGEFVGDGKHDLVQMVGNNWYLLFCVFEYRNEHSSDAILEQVLASTVHRWQALANGAKSAHHASPLGRKAFVELTQKWAQIDQEGIQRFLEEKEREIERVRRELADLQYGYAFTRRSYEALRDGAKIKELVASLPEQYRRIRKTPRVAGLETAGDGLHVITTPLHIDDDGKRYPLGRFVIRFGKQGALFIWNLDRLHPEGVPHPHINKSGTPCMGNATSAVEKAVAESRYADAVDYVIRWLADGYEANLALNKVQEWPAQEVPLG